jgi:hypothetical protein
LSATSTAAHSRPALAPDGDELLPLKVAAKRLGIVEATYKRLHLADPDAYPATRVGVQWRVPAAFVDAKTAWPRGGRS